MNPYPVTRTLLAALSLFLLSLSSAAPGSTGQEPVEPAQVAMATDLLAPPADDMALVREVKSRLLADEDLDGNRINVDSLRGRITLYGTVEDETLVERARQLAESVDGVEAVSSRLRSLTP